MKKPAKPKPKRRNPPGLPRHEGSAPVIARASSLARLAEALPLPAPPSRARLDAVSPRDDRLAFTLLLMPFLIVAVSLGLSQTRRANLPALPEIAAPAPPAAHTRPALPLPPIAHFDPAPAPPTVVPPANDIVVPGPAPRFPPPAPVVEVPAPKPLPVIAAPMPNDIVVPGPAPRFPPPFPAIEPAAPPPSSVPVTAPSPAPRAANVTIAALDPRPPAPVPLPPPAPIDAGAPPGIGVCAATPEKLASFSNSGRLARAPRKPRLIGVDADTFGRRLSAAALAQTEDLVIYTARYQAMAYPMGDVLSMHGACIDVVIRAYRELGIDLQEEIQRARRTRGDANIDHRRTENLRRFLEKHGTSLPITAFPENFKPGDIVTYHRPFSRISTSHIAIVTDVLAPTGRPMIVHNRGYGPQLEDALFVDRITGHYRYLGPRAPDSAAEKPATGGKTQPVVRASYPQR